MIHSLYELLVEAGVDRPQILNNLFTFDLIRVPTFFISKELSSVTKVIIRCTIADIFRIIISSHGPNLREAANKDYFQ